MYWLVIIEILRFCTGLWTLQISKRTVHSLDYYFVLNLADYKFVNTF